jgi:hypothetical protein
MGVESKRLVKVKGKKVKIQRVDRLNVIGRWSGEKKGEPTRRTVNGQ